MCYNEPHSISEYEYPRSAKPKKSVDPLREDYLKLLETSQNSDVTFIVNGEKIKAHKTILAARSDYFRNMFDADMRENLSNEVEITDADPAVFRALLEHVYAGIDPPVEIALDVLVIADKYGLEHLKRLCEGLVFTNLDCGFWVRGDVTVVDVLIVAERVGCEDLKNRAMSFLSENLNLASEEERAKLKNDPDLLFQLFERCVKKNV